MTRRIARLKITRSRLLTIERDAFHLRLHCPRCEREVEMLTSAQAAGVLEVDTWAVKRLLADGKIHAVQTVSGHIRVCKDSLFLM